VDKEESKLRVFISYSHEDSEVVKIIAKMLEGNGLRPMWDENFAFGIGFHDQIKSYIAHAHVFLPVITESSSGWVHQEIGYATALNIPVLPVVIVDERLPEEVVEKLLPQGMIERLLAVRVDRDLSGLGERLTLEALESLLHRYRDSAPALFECAQLTQDRAVMLAAYAHDVLDMKMVGRVRQRGALSSFHIPRHHLEHEFWLKRYGERGLEPFHCERLRGERKALDEHARKAGCRIIIDPTLEYGMYGPAARKVRLQSLLEFLAPNEFLTPGTVADLPVDDVQVAINPAMSNKENVIIVGNFYYAQAMSGAIGKGYRQTIFTRHAPTMAAEIKAFDEKFDWLIAKAGWTAASSRERAGQHLREIIATLPSSE